MIRILITGLLVLILMGVAACNTTPSSNQPPSLESPDSPIVSAPDSSIAPNVVQSIQVALSQESNLAVEDIVLQEAEAVEWGDACLGLPQPNEMCAQVITPGYRLVFTTPQGERVVHSDRTGQVFRVSP